MISQLTVRNFKALRDVTLGLTPLHLLIGPNDSGKTSILEALRAVCLSADCELQEAFRGSWSGRELVWNKDPKAPVELLVEAEEEGDRVAYALSVTFPPSGRKVTCRQKSTDPDSVDEAVRLRLAREGLEKGVARAGTEKEIRKLIAGVQFYRWIPRFLSLPNAPDVSRRFRMDPTGFGLALCLDDIIGYDRKLFDALENQFKSLFPHVEIIRLLPEKAYLAPASPHAEVPELKKADGKGLYFQLVDGPEIPASQASDGMLLILAYLAIFHLPKPPRVLLIEEPENGIHPARLTEVLSILRRLVESQNRPQIMMTTHSPYVVDLFRPEEVTLCVKGEDGAVRVRRLSESKAVREQIDIFTLGEIWTSSEDRKLIEPPIAGEVASA